MVLLFVLHVEGFFGDLVTARFLFLGSIFMGLLVLLVLIVEFLFGWFLLQIPPPEESDKEEGRGQAKNETTEKKGEQLNF